MKDILERTIFITTGYIESSKPLVIVLIVIGVTMGAANGYKYFQFATSDPKFCELCHLMNEPHKSLKASSHKKISCQKCHASTLIEQNALLLSYVLSGHTKKTPQKHGRTAPWNSCETCHSGKAEQAAILMRTSFADAQRVICPRQRTFLSPTMTAYVSNGKTSRP